jgi:hypothetical protein
LPELPPADHVDGTINQGDAGRPGVAEQMLVDARPGVRPTGHGAGHHRAARLDMTVRALAAAGPAWPALQQVGADRFAEAVREALRPLYVEGLGVRIVSEFGWITGPVPGS